MTTDTVLSMDQVRAALAENNLDGMGVQASIQLAGLARAIEQAVLQSLPAQTSSTIRGDSYAGVYVWFGSDNILHHIPKILAESANDPQNMLDAVASKCIQKLERHNALQSPEVQRLRAEVDHLKRELKVATDLAQQRLGSIQMPVDKPSVWPMSPHQFEVASEFIAMELAEQDGHEGDKKHRLLWEGNPPEPWGEVWQKYISDARVLLSAGIEGIQEQERMGLAYAPQIGSSHEPS